MGMTENLEALLASGQDNALLRFTLGSALFKKGDTQHALEHLQVAVAQDPAYSAAWKIYGKALHASGDRDAAEQAFITGITAAERKGDIQAAKEMQVFLRRLQRNDKSKTDGDN
ncbi:MAG: tetratricopeptide repeat protein [Gammaproteobacteria bacterium]